ncbi:MAG: CDP-alcohol phosphatidyltransferase family protein [Candidatus Pacebacteria bacterium]|nr:CDP-alcohol phosphatidyltransferase family protein [Candidatus Paceibacterota bacterium]
MFTDNLRKKFSSVSLAAGKTLGGMGLTPNHLTSLCLIFGLGASYAISQGMFYLAIILLLVSGVMDFLDGSVARACNKETKFGGLFDSTVDKLTEILIYIALGLYDPSLLLGSCLAISTFMLSSYISKHAKASGGKGGGGIIERKERIILLVFGMMFIQYMPYILYFIAAFSFITCLQRFYRNYRLLK